MSAFTSARSAACSGGAAAVVCAASGHGVKSKAAMKMRAITQVSESPGTRQSAIHIAAQRIHEKNENVLSDSVTATTIL
jgi:hypothetical protein